MGEKPCSYCTAQVCFADAASKHATQAFFDCLRAEVEQFEIDVTVVSPGYIQTNLSLNAITADGSQYGGEAWPPVSTRKSDPVFCITGERAKPLCLQQVSVSWTGVICIGRVLQIGCSWPEEQEKTPKILDTVKEGVSVSPSTQPEPFYTEQSY